MEPVRVGFIGAGIFSMWAIYPALYLAPIELRAVCDIDEEKAKTAASKFGASRWYTDHRRMFEREELDAVIIWMGPQPRPPLIRDALAAGYHVMIPKPPALSLAEAVDLAEAARRANKILMVDFQRRFSFGIRRAKEIMATPAFGRVTQVLCSFCSGPYDAVRGAGYDNPIRAFLTDFAVHHFDLVRYLGGEVVQAAVYHQELDGGGAFALALQFAGGAVGTLQVNSQRIWWRNYDRIEITGQGEFIVVDGLWGVKHYTQAHNTFTENYSDERSVELTGDAYALIEFAEAIREQRQPNASIHDCLGSMRLYQAVFDAHQSGRSGVLALNTHPPLVSP